MRNKLIALTPHVSKHSPLFACSMLLILSTIAAQCQGFGVFSPKSVTINRLLPPTVNLKGKAVRVEATVASQFQSAGPIDQALKTKLVTLIQKDPRFILSETNPQTILKYTITNFYVEQYTITSTSFLNSGSKETRNAWRGKMEVSYQAIEAGSGVALDSENLSEVAGYDIETAGSNPFQTHRKRDAAEASANETRDQLIDGIVEKMGVRIAPLDQPFVAKLPGGKLDALSALAMSNRWGDLQEKAEALDKLPKPQDDSYRVYLVALAKEAQAYQLTHEANDQDLGKRTDVTPEQAEKDIQRAQKYMDEAGTLYKQAAELNPKEKEFRQGDNRTEQAMLTYATIARYKEEYRKAKEKEAQLATLNTRAPGSAGGKGVEMHVANSKTPLDQILDFCTHNVDADSIREYIQSPDFLQDARASGYKFNFSRDAIALQSNCKANAPQFQRLMRARLASSNPTQKTK